VKFPAQYRTEAGSQGPAPTIERAFDLLRKRSVPWRWSAPSCAGRAAARPIRRSWTRSACRCT